MKKYISCIMGLLMSAVLIQAALPSDRNTSDRLPAGWLQIGQDVMTPDELQEYAQYLIDRKKYQDVDEKMQTKALIIDDQIGKKAFNCVAKNSQTWSQIFVNFLVAVLKK